MFLVDLALKFLPKLLGGVGKLITGGSALLLAIVTAFPAALSALGDFFNKLAEALKNPTFALLFGVLLAGPIAFIYGLTWDYSLRKQIRADAISSANYRADLAIAKVRRDYEAKIAELTKRRKK